MLQWAVSSQETVARFIVGVCESALWAQIGTILSIITALCYSPKYGREAGDLLIYVMHKLQEARSGKHDKGSPDAAWGFDLAQIVVGPNVPWTTRLEVILAVLPSCLLCLPVPLPPVFSRD